MTHTEAKEWVAGNRSTSGMVTIDPVETREERIACTDAAMKEQAYWTLKAYNEGLIESEPTGELERERDYLRDLLEEALLFVVPWAEMDAVGTGEDDNCGVNRATVIRDAICAVLKSEPHTLPASPVSAFECWAWYTITDGKVVTYAQGFRESSRRPVWKEAIGCFEISASRNAVMVPRCIIGHADELDAFRDAMAMAYQMHCELMECNGRPEWDQPKQPIAGRCRSRKDRP